MNEDALSTAEAAAETALDALRRGWPHPDIDPDLIIGASLKDIPRLCAEVRRLRQTLSHIATQTTEGGTQFVALSALGESAFA